MRLLKTCPALVPPPPVPPIPRAPAAAADPSPEPRRTSYAGYSTRHQSFAQSFTHDVIQELRHVSWPVRAEIMAATLVTIGLVSFFAVYIGGLNMIVSNLFHLLGLYAW